MTGPYRHTQVGWAIILPVLGGVLLLLFTVFFLAGPGDATAVVVSVIVAVVLFVALVFFGSLTVNVDRDAVDLAFGVGWVRVSVPLDDVVQARRVRNSWVAGWGVRMIPGGRLYNVSGLQAVELKLMNGRVVRVGSDEPDALLTAVNAALTARGARREDTGVWTSWREEP
jgi:hypothetical protein